jgi:hypothetical protein
MVVLIAVLSVITALGMYFFITASNLENVKRSIIERGIVAETNEVEFLKQNLHQALDYSFYQSKYDVAGLGGYAKLADAPITHNNLPYWRVYDDTNPSPSLETYKKNLGDKTLDIYSMYSDSINTEISKPEVSELTVERKVAPEADYAIVTAFSTKPIKLEKPNLTIEENGTIKEIIQTNIFNQFDIGKSNFVDTDSISQAVSDAIAAAKIDDNLADSGSLTYHCTDGVYPSGRAVFVAATGKTVEEAENDINTSIKNKIADLENKLNSNYESEFDIHLSLIGDDIQSKVEMSCGHSSGDSDDCRTCCCNELGNPYPCGKWYKTECDFYYYGAARVLVDIIDKTKTYAVYDEEIGNNDLRNIQLKFYVLSGNKDLITPQ